MTLARTSLITTRSQIELRDGSLNNPECPLTCTRSSSTIALTSSISSFSSTFSPCSFPVFLSLSLESTVLEDVLGVFVGVLLVGISLSFTSMARICRRDALVQIYISNRQPHVESSNLSDHVMTRFQPRNPWLKTFLSR